MRISTPDPKGFSPIANQTNMGDMTLKIDRLV